VLSGGAKKAPQDRQNSLAVSRDIRKAVYLIYQKLSMHADPSVDTLGFSFWTHSQGAFPPSRWGRLILSLTRKAGLTRRRSRRWSPCGTSPKTRVGFLASGRGRCEIRTGSAWSPLRLASRFFCSCSVQRCAPVGLGNCREGHLRWSGAGRETGLTRPTLRLPAGSAPGPPAQAAYGQPWASWPLIYQKLNGSSAGTVGSSGYVGW